MDYRPLNDIPLKTLHTVFSKAFADYPVDMRMPLSRFMSMLNGNGFDAETSVGAFDGERLVGFIFCAPRRYLGKNSLYDCGTGVLPSYRGQGVAGSMLTYLRENVPAERLVLEVIQSNVPAVQLYERHGFNIIRELDCLYADAAMLRVEAKMPVTLMDKLPDVFLAQARELWNYAPSWQNSIVSILQQEETYLSAVIADGTFLIGYATMQRASGSIAQIAVRPEYRGLAVGQTLIYALSTQAESARLYCINVDTRDSVSLRALSAWGFDSYVTQYEMALSLC